MIILVIVYFRVTTVTDSNVIEGVHKQSYAAYRNSKSNRENFKTETSFCNWMRKTRRRCFAEVRPS